jgi:hypothetical protein
VNVLYLGGNSVSVPSKTRAIQLVKIRPEERLATTSELNLAPSLVTGCCEAKRMGYWAATQVKGLSSEITIVSVADVFHVAEGSILITVIGQGDESPTESKTMARYQKDSMGTREAQGVLHNGVCNSKPIDGELLQKTPWESDQPIVPKKQGNACRGKGLAGGPLVWGHFLQTQNWVNEVNKTIPVTYLAEDGEVLLRSRMRENLMSGSVRGFIAAPRKENFPRRWL